jgi:hypothetical protein
MEKTRGARDRVAMTQVLGHKRPGTDPDLCKGQQDKEPGNCCWCRQRALVQQAETRVTQLVTKSTSEEKTGEKPSAWIRDQVRLERKVHCSRVLSTTGGWV